MARVFSAAPRWQQTCLNRVPKRGIQTPCSFMPVVSRMAWACKRILRQLPNGSGGPLTPATREPSNGAGLMGYPTSRSSALFYRNRARSLNVAPKNRFRQKTTNQPTPFARKDEDDVSEGSSLCICGAPRRQRSKIEDEEGVSEGSSLCICGAPRRQRSKIEDERR